MTMIHLTLGAAQLRAVYEAVHFRTMGECDELDYHEEQALHSAKRRLGEALDKFEDPPPLVVR
jgi:hypothetical protein